jgi:CDP-diacylglycerol---serine O-phosphatidyltransferase
MDPIVPQLEKETRRRRRRRMFSHARIPVRMMVPNFFTLLGLCAGLTSIRMSIEGRYDWALAAIVFAALLDGIDGRIARLLKASSRFGAELDSLADFVNFGVAPAIMIFTWAALGEQRGIGWIAVLIFALGSALRLARFNATLDDDRPKWQANFFMGVPTPAAAIVVLLPVYLEHLGLDPRGNDWSMSLVIAYTILVGVMMVTIIPTYSGKLLGERISREWVLPLFILVISVVAYLVTYPYRTLAIGTLLYLAFIPLSWKRFRALEQQNSAAPATAPATTPAQPSAATETPPASDAPRTTYSDDPRVVEIRPSEPKR